MTETSEFRALMALLEDPDAAVFDAVSNRIMAYGTPVIPLLENCWENTIDNAIQERIEMIIHKLHFNEIYSGLEQWKNSLSHELLPAMLFVSRLLYPDLQTEKTIADIENVKRNIWLELNNYLTPLEQVNVIKNILYRYFNIKGNINNPKKPGEYLVSHILETKKGNQTGIGTLYLILTEWLDIPVQLLPVPHQFVLAYFNKSREKPAEQYNIDFFIEPSTGQVFTHNDLHRYFQSISVVVREEHYAPQNNVMVIKKILTDFRECFSEDSNAHIADEINSLIELLD